MKLPELECQCPECKGTGRIRNIEWEKWDKKLEQKAKETGYTTEKLSIQWIEKHCPPPGIDVPEEELCPECEGTGYMPTKEGKELLFFIRKYF